MTIAHLYVCCICLNYRALWGDQTDPKYAGWGTNLILRTGPPTPSAENLFAEKPLAGTPLPLSGSRPKVPEKNAPKRARISVILAKNTCFQADFFLAELGGTPPPLTEKIG